MPQILMLAGDVNLQGRADPADAFTHVLGLLASADLRFVNLEGALCGSGNDPHVPDIAHKPNWRHSAPDMVKGLVAAGIEAVGVANNVTFPPTAMLASLDTLDHLLAFRDGRRKADSRSGEPTRLNLLRARPAIG